MERERGRSRPDALRTGGWQRHAGLIVATAIALFVLVTGSLAGVEEQWRQSRDGFMPRAASGKLVLVEIDAKSLAAMGQWPWPRRLHASLIDRLDALGSDAIAFDVDFTARSNAVDDVALASAIERARASVILPTFRQPASSGSTTYIENLPLPAFRSGAMLASVNVHPDPGGQLSRYGYGIVTDGMARPSLAAMLAGSAGRMNESFRIDTAIDPATIPRISASDVLAGRVDPAQVRGKQIVVGATAIETGDRYATPRHGVIPGATIQMLAAETLLAGSQTPPFDPLYAVVLTLAIVGLMGRIRGPSTQALCRGVWLLALIVAPVVFEALGIRPVEVVPALAVLATHWLWTASRGFAARLQAERLTDPVTKLPNGRAFARFNQNRGAISAVVVRFRWFEEMDAQLDDATRALWAERTLDRLSLGLPGQTFHILAPGVLAWSEIDADQAALAERIESTSALFRAPLQLGDRSVLVTPSFGICAGHGHSSRQVVAQAMLAARHSQTSGRIWSVHSAEAADEAQRALTLLGDIDGAIAAGDIRIAYQPKWSIPGNRVCGAEALVRWHHPVLGPISPDNFIPLLEDSGNMARLTLAIVDICLADLASWHASGSEISVAINISASLVEDAVFVDELNVRLGKVPDLIRFVTLEVTESAAVAQTEVAVGVLTALRASGVRISIDDYGTGRATLAYLKAFPADEVKIDKSFVTNLLATPSDQILVRSTIELGRELDFQIVAEGVEDADCLAKLAEYGCDIAQGWHIGRPIDALAFRARWIDNAVPEPLTKVA